jgi:hypothetical protein
MMGMPVPEGSTMSEYSKEADFLKITGDAREEQVVLNMQDTRADVPHHTHYLTIPQAEAAISALRAGIALAKRWRPGHYAEPFATERRS